MKREFSFKGGSRVTTHIHENEQAPLQENDFISNKISRNAWTDLRVEEIKRKYDTPSHKKKQNSSLSFQDCPRQYRKSLQPNNSEISHRPLRQSYVMNQAKPENHLKKEIGSKYRFDENEKTVFDKIEQMKNCLIQEKQKKENMPPRELKKYREYPQSQINPRVSNIDKINDKIKRILDCLHQNDSSIQNQRIQTKNSVLKQSVFSKCDFQDKLEETQIISKQKAGQINAWDNFNLKKSECEGKSDIYEVSKFCRQTKSPNNYPEPTQGLSHYMNNSRMRSRSCLNYQKDQAKEVSNKKIDDQIAKITTRIKQFEEEKKKLNIEFKPFDCSMKNSKSVDKILVHKSNRKKPPLPIKEKIHDFSYSKHHRSNTDFKLRLSTHEKLETNEKQSVIKHEYQAKYEEEIQHEQHTKQSSVFEVDCKDQQKQSQIQILRVQTDEGMEKRKKKLLETTTLTFAKETKRLIENLFQQVKLDEKFRNSKIWIRDTLIEDKWEKVREEAYKKGKSLNLEETQKEYDVCEDEDNPFYSIRENENSIQELIRNHINAQEHWAQEILHKFNIAQFRAEEFNAEKIDLQRKGFFILEDLVRFINMETGTFYRNRDLYLIFRRLTKTTKISFDKFLGVLTDAM